MDQLFLTVIQQAIPQLRRLLQKSKGPIANPTPPLPKVGGPAPHAPKIGGAAPEAPKAAQPYRPLRPGERWITLQHPAGGGDGVHVLVSQNLDGTYSVVAGAAGKLQHLRLRNVRQPEEYDKKAKRQPKPPDDDEVQLSPEMKADMSARKFKLKQEFVARIREQIGGVAEDLEREQLDQIGPDRAGKAVEDHLNKQLRQAKAALKEHKKKLIQDKEYRERVDLGLVPLSDPADLALQDIDDRPAKGGKGYHQESKEIATKTALEEIKNIDLASAEREAETVRLIAASEGSHPAEQFRAEAKEILAEAIRIRDEEPEEAAKLVIKAERLEGKYEKYIEEDPNKVTAKLAREAASKEGEAAEKAIRESGLTDADYVPLKDEEAAEIKDLLKLEKSLKAALSEAEKARQPKGIEPNILLQYASDIPDAAIEEELENGVRAELARSLRSAVDASHGDYQKNYLDGHYQAFNNVAVSILGESPITRSTFDVLGVNQSMALLAWYLDQQGYDLSKVAQGIEKFHQEQVNSITQRALAQARDYLDRAKTLEVELASPLEFETAYEANLERETNLKEAQKILSATLGKLEHNALLHTRFNEYTRKGVPNVLEIASGGMETNITLAKGLGLTAHDYGRARGHIEIPEKSFGKIIEPVDGEQLRRNQRTIEIKRGEMERGWIPGGFKSRPGSSFDYSGISANGDPGLSPAVLPRLSAGMPPEEIRRHVKQYLAESIGPRSIEEMRNELRSTLFIANHVDSAVEGEFRKAVDEIFPHEKYVSDQTGERVNRLVAEIKGKNHDSQVLDEAHPEINEVAYRALSNIPEGRFAFKPIGEMTSQDQRALRQYWYENFGKSAETAVAEEKKRYESMKDADFAQPGNRYPKHEWSKLKEEAGGTNRQALEKIQAMVRAQEEKEAAGSMMSLFGDDPAPKRGIGHVKLDDLDSLIEHIEPNPQYRQIIRDEVKDNGSHELFDADTGQTSRVPAREYWQRELTKRAEEKLRDYWESRVMKFTPEEKARKEDAPPSAKDFQVDWANYVESMGGLENAYDTVQSHIRGEYARHFARHYEKLTGNALELRAERLKNWDKHEIGSLTRDQARRVLEQRAKQAQSELAQVRKRSGGKFVKESDSVKERAEQQKFEQERRQLTIESQEESKQASKYRSPIAIDTVSPGKTVEQQLGRIISPALANAFEDGKPVKEIKDFSMSGHFQDQQRVIKMLESQRRLYGAMGVGSGKTAVSIGGFTHLKEQGKAKKGLFLVPTHVQGQFIEHAKSLTEPGKFTWTARPGQSFEKRLEDYKNKDMMIVTHQTFRDDMIRLYGQQHGLEFDAAREKFMQLSKKEQADTLGAVKKAHGLEHDYVYIDEAHMLSNRQGKENSLMADVIDAHNHPGNIGYLLLGSGTPVKNDVSEAFDILSKVDPHRYDNRERFMGKYGINPQESLPVIQKELSSYYYKGRIDPELDITWQDNPLVENGETKARERLPLTPKQQAAYDEIGQAYQTAQDAFQLQIPRDQIAQKEFAGNPAGTLRSLNHLYDHLDDLDIPAYLKKQIREVKAQPDEAILKELNTGGHLGQLARETLLDIYGNGHLKLEAMGVPVDSYRGVDVNAVKTLSPGSFKNAPEEQHEEIARRLSRNLGIIRESAHNRIVNMFDGDHDGSLRQAYDAAIKSGDEKKIAASRGKLVDSIMEHNAKIRAMVPVVEHEIRHGKWIHQESGEERSGRPQLIFANNHASVQNLQLCLESKGIRVATIHGGLSAAEKDQVRNRFQAGQLDCVILTAAGESGLNLQAAKSLNHFDIPDTAKAHEQRTGRINRTGQDGSIKVHNWITATEHEEKKYRRLKSKYALANYFQDPHISQDDSDIMNYLVQDQIRRHEGAGDFRKVA